MAEANGLVMWYVKLIDEDGKTISTNVFELGTVSEDKAFIKACEISSVDPDDVNPEDCSFANSKNADQRDKIWIVILGDDDQGDIDD